MDQTINIGIKNSNSDCSVHFFTGKSGCSSKKASTRLLSVKAIEYYFAFRDLKICNQRIDTSKVKRSIAAVKFFFVFLFLLMYKL